MTFASTRQNKKRPRPPSKASVFAKAHRELRPKDLVLPAEPGSQNGILFRVNSVGWLVIENYTFTARDALRIGRWIEENFR